MNYLPARQARSSRSHRRARCRTQVFRFDKGNARHCRDDKLGDPRAAHNFERLGAKVDQEHTDLAAIIRVDRARRIQDRDTAMQRDTGARPHLPS